MNKWQVIEGEEPAGEVPLPLQLGHTLHLIGIVSLWRGGALIDNRERLEQVKGLQNKKICSANSLHQRNGVKEIYGLFFIQLCIVSYVFYKP